MQNADRPSIDRHEILSLQKYMMIRAAAKFLGITPNTLRNWERQGKISTYRNPYNKYRLYLRQDLIDLLNYISLTKSECIELNNGGE